MSVQSTVVRVGTQTGRAISAIVYLLTTALLIRFLLNQTPDTLAHVLMVVPLAVICLAGSWVYSRYLS